jgi:hypothetical protein
MRSAVTPWLRCSVADPPPPPPNPVLGLEATEVAADAIAVKWTASSVLDWAVGRDGADVFGSGAWSTTLAPSTDRFRFTSLLPATTYTITLRSGRRTQRHGQGHHRGGRSPAPAAASHGRRPRATRAGRRVGRPRARSRRLPRHRGGPGEVEPLRLGRPQRQGAAQALAVHHRRRPDRARRAGAARGGHPEGTTGGMAHRKSQRVRTVGGADAGARAATRGTTPSCSLALGGELAGRR